MRNLNYSYHVLYRQAIVDPSKLTEEDLLELMVRYPYSQPLILAYERRKKLINQESDNKELALLYSPNASWLWNYVNRPVPYVEEIQPEEEDYISFEEWEKQQVVDDFTALDAEPEIQPESETVQEPEQEAVTIADDAEAESIPEEIDEAPTLQHSKEDDDLAKLVLAAGVGADYFFFNTNEKKDVQGVATVKPSAETADKEENENISLYNDDLMPYSFRWWLHKTRLEYAESYKPFATVNIPTEKHNEGFDTKIIEENILDQQIKESIIHFQDPEMKLSDAVKRKPLQPIEPKRSDDIIERFIREEPVIQPPAPDNLNNENMARQSAEYNFDLVTETLANIYVDQAMFLKAIEVFKKLILKYPEKKSYFATRIREVEKKL